MYRISPHQEIDERQLEVIEHRHSLVDLGPWDRCTYNDQSQYVNRKYSGSDWT